MREPLPSPTALSSPALWLSLLLSLLPDIILFPQGQGSNSSPQGPQCPFLIVAFRVPRILCLEQVRNLLEGHGVAHGLQILEETGLGCPKGLSPTPAGDLAVTIF